MLFTIYYMLCCAMYYTLYYTYYSTQSYHSVVYYIVSYYSIVHHILLDIRPKIPRSHDTLMGLGCNSCHTILSLCYTILSYSTLHACYAMQ